MSAQQLVEEMKAYLAGKQVRPQRLPPPPSSPPPEPPNGFSRRDQMAMFNAQSHREYTGQRRQGSAVARPVPIARPILTVRTDL